MTNNMPENVRQHEATGRYISVRGHQIFVRDEGQGEPVLLLHGVPSSSFLYRKITPRLAAAGYRAVAPDFPGLGLSDKPADIPYDWHALAAWLGDIVAAIDLPPVHLVVHDIGGPIGLEWAISQPEQVRSITFLNSLLDLAHFKKPFPMWLFDIPLLRHIAFVTLNTILFKPIMRWRGVQDRAVTGTPMVAAYIWLLKHKDGRGPFLDIMAGFDLRAEHQRFLVEGTRQLDFYRQLIWGENDPALSRREADYISRALDIEQRHWLPARHFLQEDQAPALVAHLTGFFDQLRLDLENRHDH
jgi:pimeloyl-ACP methyl ester carboxylesterase